MYYANDFLPLGERLNDHISYYEPLALTASYMRSTKDKLTAKFDFKAHGRFIDRSNEAAVLLAVRLQYCYQKKETVTIDH